MTKKLAAALLVLTVWSTPGGAQEMNDATKLLFLAIEADDTDAARAFIDAGAQLDARNEYNNAALHTAVVYDRIEMVALLIDAGADMNQKGMGDLTALHLAAREGQLEIARLLLDSGADVNAKAGTGAGGLTPFGIAMISGQFDAMSLIESYGGQ